MNSKSDNFKIITIERDNIAGLAFHFEHEYKSVSDMRLTIRNTLTTAGFTYMEDYTINSTFVKTAEGQWQTMPVVYMNDKTNESLVYLKMTLG